MKKIFNVTLMLISYVTLLAQGVGINNDGSVPHPSAILDIKSSTKGLLIPRTSTATRTGILNGPNGLMMYDTTIGSFWFQNGGVWIEAGRLDVVNSNAFFGYQSGKSIPQGEFNSGFGPEALFSNTDGNGNTSLGTSSMHTNTTGNNNTAVGMFSLFFNTTGSSNAAIGNNAMLLNQTGYGNVAVGSNALFKNSRGYHLVAIGDSSLYHTTNGFTTAAVGSKSGYSNIDGFDNSFFGDSSGYNNTSGYANTFVGTGSGSTNTTAAGNSFFGAYSGYFNTGEDNAFFGTSAGYLNTSGSNNCFIGTGAGNNSSGGNYLTALGTYANPNGNGLSYATAIGAKALVNCSNCLALGGIASNGGQTKVGINNMTPVTDLHIIQQTDASGDKVRGIRLQRSVNTNHWRTMIDPSNNYIFEYNDNLYSYVEPVGGAFVNPSDVRLKKDITPLPGVLDKLLLLQPKTYQYIATSDAGRTSYGFLAQDVEKLFPEFVFSSETGIKGIAYSNFSVIAVKAIQEQQQMIDEQKQKLDQQQSQIEAMLKRIELLEKKN